MYFCFGEIEGYLIVILLFLSCVSKSSLVIPDAVSIDLNCACVIVLTPLVVTIDIGVIPSTVIFVGRIVGCFITGGVVVVEVLSGADIVFNPASAITIPQSIEVILAPSIPSVTNPFSFMYLLILSNAFAISVGSLSLFTSTSLIVYFSTTFLIHCLCMSLPASSVDVLP